MIRQQNYVCHFGVSAANVNSVLFLFLFPLPTLPQMSATMTTTAGLSTAISSSPPHRRRARRRLSTPSTGKPRLQRCQPLPLSLEALDLSSASPTQTLASLRYLILSYLADLETRLCQFESPDLETLKAMGEMTLEEARQWARTALEMLEGIRADVCSHLPEFHFADISVESFKSHFPDLPDVPGLTEMRSRLPDIPDVRSHLPDMPDVRSHLSDMRTKLDDVRSRFHDIDFKPQSYIPTLSARWKTLHSHLSSMQLPSSLGVPAVAPSSVIADLLDALHSPELVTELLSAKPNGMNEAEDIVERAAREVTNAVKRSLQGVRLINYSDLPQHWRNNHFVTYGYRSVSFFSQQPPWNTHAELRSFIPIERWPLIILSLFAFHNETRQFVYICTPLPSLISITSKHPHSPNPVPSLGN